jgi:hypothetical protein
MAAFIGAMNKHGAAVAVLGAIVVVLVIVIIGYYAGRECSKDTDCGSERYCGSDFKCHEFRIIQKTEVHYDFIVPAVVVGIAIVIAAYVLRDKKR